MRNWPGWRPISLHEVLRPYTGPVIPTSGLTYIACRRKYCAINLDGNFHVQTPTEQVKYPERDVYVVTGPVPGAPLPCQHQSILAHPRGAAREEKYVGGWVGVDLMASKRARSTGNEILWEWSAGRDPTELYIGEISGRPFLRLESGQRCQQQ